jgi:hypothetical protein
MCYAQNSYDDATDPTYADGWQAGDNGGTGFTPWNFDSSYFWPVDGNWYPFAHADFHAVDDGLQNGTHYSNPFNNLGSKAWAMGISPTNDGTVRAGRGFSPLEIGDTINVIFDNPTDRQFFKGYYIRLNSTFESSIDGMPINGNICKGAGANCTPNGTPPAHKMYLSRFEYFDDGEWVMFDADDPEPPVSDSTPTAVFDTDTAVAGARLSVTRTGADTYDVLLDPLGPGPSFSNPTPFTFANPGRPVNWIEFTFFNTLTDDGSPPTVATDLYIRSIEIIRAAAPGLLGDFNEDNSVDAADYVVWRKGIGVAMTPENHNLWRTNFGRTAGSGAGTGATGAIPEPTTLVLLVVVGLGALVRHRRFACRVPKLDW